MGVTVHGEKVEIKLCEAAHSGFNCCADVKEFHVEKDALAVFVLQLLRERKATACEHTEADFVEAYGVAKFGSELKPRDGIWDIEGDDEAII